MYEFIYRAQFNVIHPKRSLRALTHLLKRSPSTEITKGDLQKTGRPAKVSCISWLLHAGEEISSDELPLDIAITKLLVEVSKGKAKLRAALRDGGQAAIEVAIRPETSYSVASLSPVLFSKLHDMQIGLDICCVVPSGRLH
jgi:hypothetical protein